jgi:hypothetical protein
MFGAFDKHDFLTTLVLNKCFLRNYVEFVGYYFVSGGGEETATKGSEVDCSERKDDGWEMLRKMSSSASLLFGT